MVFVSRNQSADLSLTTPLEFCCNCGTRGQIDLVDTPLRKTRYFLFFGTELTLHETFPYCQMCRETAERVRPGLMGKLLMVGLVTSVVFLVLVFSAKSLPTVVSENLFNSSVLVAVVWTALYYAFQDRSRPGRSHYQPVSLVDAQVQGDRIARYRLKFFNPKYAAVFRKANPELIRAGVLQVDANAKK